MDDVRIEAAAKSLAQLAPDEPWPTNKMLGGRSAETRDDDFKQGHIILAEEMLQAADAVDPLRNPRMVTTDEEFAALPTDARIWGSSHRLPGVAGSGSPYVKLEDGMWWDFGNDYAVGSDDIMRPAVVVYWPTEAP